MDAAPYAGAVTSKNRILALAAAAALALTLSACSTAPAAEPTPTTAPTTDALQLSTAGACEGDEGVTLVVDASALGEESESWCVVADDTIDASWVLTAAGVETEGTVEYGDAVVCRVDGLPSATEPVGSTEDPAYVEACEAMPAAFAYWSLWLKPAGGTWDYATEGVETLTVAPGDSLELLFTLDGAPATPAA